MKQEHYKTTASVVSKQESALTDTAPCSVFLTTKHVSCKI